MIPVRRVGDTKLMEAIECLVAFAVFKTDRHPLRVRGVRFPFASALRSGHREVPVTGAPRLQAVRHVGAVGSVAWTSLSERP